MNKIYMYFIIFFMGSLLPFLIVEFYFKDWVAIGIIVIITSVVLTLSISLAYLKNKFIRWSDVRNREIDYLNWTHKKEKAGRASSYFFRKNFW